MSTETTTTTAADDTEVPLRMALVMGGLSRDEADDAIREHTAAVQRARDEVVIGWLGKKACEHRARGPQYAKQADVIATMADKIRRGAARPDNLLGAPDPTATVDLTEWADKLAAVGLQPDEHELTWKAGQQPIVRVHFAFHERLGSEARDYLVQAVGEALQDQLRTAGQFPTA